MYAIPITIQGKDKEIFNEILSDLISVMEKHVENQDQERLIIAYAALKTTIDIITEDIENLDNF